MNTNLMNDRQDAGPTKNEIAFPRNARFHSSEDRMTASYKRLQGGVQCADPQCGVATLLKTRGMKDCFQKDLSETVAFLFGQQVCGRRDY